MELDGSFLEGIGVLGWLRKRNLRGQGPVGQHRHDHKSDDNSKGCHAELSEKGRNTRKLQTKRAHRQGLHPAGPQPAADDLRQGTDDRGRNGDCSPPPAQTRTGPIRASGLYGAPFVKGSARH